MNLHEIIQKPLVTEKSNIGREEGNVVTLAVDPRANKHEIANAVEQLFDVSVLEVRTMRMPQSKSATPPTMLMIVSTVPMCFPFQVSGPMRRMVDPPGGPGANSPPSKPH